MTSLSSSAKWDLRFLALAEHVAHWSKDPRARCGAVIARPDRRIVSLGYNGFPQGMPDDDALYADREEKLSRVVHAEMNALLFAAQPVDGCTVYTWPMGACDRCFAHLAQAGITRLVSVLPTADHLAHWGEAMARVRRYAAEMGIEIVEVAR